jgi:PKD repeat protein
MNISKYSVLWAFGDGTQSAELYPTHTYSESGEYLVTVTITDVSGKQIVKTYTIVVSETLAGSASSISEVSENGVGWWLLFVGFISIACIVFVIYSKKLRNN